MSLDQDRLQARTSRGRLVDLSGGGGRRRIAVGDGHVIERWDERVIRACWALLPGGPQRRGAAEWRYLATVVPDPDEHAFTHHRFRHASHPDYGGQSCNVDVADSDLGPELCTVSVGRQVVPVPPCHVKECRRNRHLGPHLLGDPK